MTMSDPLADMLTRIRNGQRAKKQTIVAKPSSLHGAVLEVLQREGYIRGYKQTEIRKGVGEITIELKYHEGEPVIRKITRISRPGQRIYAKISDLPRVLSGLGISILSTPRGVMSDGEARTANVGGEVICQVY